MSSLDHHRPAGRQAPMATPSTFGVARGAFVAAADVVVSAAGLNPFVWPAVEGGAYRPGARAGTASLPLDRGSLSDPKCLILEGFRLPEAYRP